MRERCSASGHLPILYGLDSAFVRHRAGWVGRSRFGVKTEVVVGTIVSEQFGTCGVSRTVGFDAGVTFFAGATIGRSMAMKEKWIKG